MFRVTSDNNRGYSYKERNGYIKKSKGEHCILESGDFLSKAELMKSLPKGFRKDLILAGPKTEFDVGSIGKTGIRIADSMAMIKDLEWEVVFKSFTKKKIVIKRKNRIKNPYFSHNSILIKFKRPGWNDFIEVGEGNVEGIGFNISGLISRVKEIVRCNTESVNKSLPENIPVILNSGEGGIIFHEIIGHSLEADHIYKGLSPFKITDIGKKLVSGNVSIDIFKEDDPFFINTYCDDEGELLPESSLIENGVLRHVISNRLFSDLLGIKDKGNSRMEDFTKRPIPRMFAIYLRNGENSASDLLDSTKIGIFAKEFGNGKVLFHKNLFYFNIPSAYMIRKGKLSEPLGSITVSGNINEVFNSVELVGNDFSYDRGISYCYKDGQTLNVRVGQPSVKICNLKLSGGSGDL